MKEEIKTYLLLNQNIKYRDFSNKLSKTIQKKVGVKIPLLRNYAKTLLKKHSMKELYDNIDEEYYEEIMLKGIIIGLEKKLTEEEFIDYIKDFVPKINDWSICDIFVSGLKLTKKYYKKTWFLLKEFLNSNNEFKIRFALVMILNYYLNDEYLDEIYLLLDKIQCEEYYVKMAKAWLLSYMIIKYYDETLKYLKNSNIDKWTYKKAITKALESLRINDVQKKELRNIRDDI